MKMDSIKKYFRIDSWKSFYFGCMTGIIVFIILFVLLCLWAGTHPATDCDSCLNGTTF